MHCEVSPVAGRPLKYKTVKELEIAIEAYFQACESKEKPPTITGLALALGFKSRQALLNYQGRAQFNDTITRAKSRVEAYAEERLFDRDGVNGAKFSLTNNFKGWSNNPSSDADADELAKAREIFRGEHGAIE